jgi:hypothetical protein
LDACLSLDYRPGKKAGPKLNPTLTGRPRIVRQTHAAARQQPWQRAGAQIARTATISEHRFQNLKKRLAISVQRLHGEISIGRPADI